MPRTGSVEVVLAPFETAHVPATAALVAARVRALRATVPALPEAWSDEAAVARLIHGLALRGSGVVALRDGEPVGFQAATLIDGHGSRWAYTPDMGHVTVGDAGGRLVEALYARISDGWVRDNCVEHVVTVLTDDAETIDTFARLGFGQTVVDLVRDLSPLDLVEADPGVAIRRAGPDDTAAIVALDQGFRRHVSAAPVFLRLGPPRAPELQRRELVDPAFATFLAEADGTPVAYLRIGPSASDVAAIVRDPGTASITGAYTVPERRGDGIATRLLAAALGWAREAGYVRGATDHESANGEAARFWARHFSPVAISMTRRLSPRLGP
jgi:GNAT superfamily N-acetyltransferase